MIGASDHFLCIFENSVVILLEKLKNFESPLFFFQNELWKH